jgi:hypothetical protein
MSQFQVNDILGKGFRYIQTAEEIIPPSVTGTRIASLGTAHWGPIGVPTLITTGQREFRNTFGEAGTNADEGWEAIYSHLANSSLGYFTRLESSAEPAKRSFKVVSTGKQPAIITGSSNIVGGLNLRPAAADSPQNILSFDITHKGSGMTTTETVSFSVNFESNSLKSYGAELISNEIISSQAFGEDQSVYIRVFDEDGVEVVDSPFAFVATGGETYSTPAQWISIVSGGMGNVGDYINFTTSGDSVKISTEPYYYGKNTKILISQDDSEVFSAGVSDNGLSVSTTALVAFLNETIKDEVAANIGGTDYTFGELYSVNLAPFSISGDGEIVFTSPSSGGDAYLEITGGNAASEIFGFSSGDASGSDAASVGTFRALRKGKEGDTIEIIVRGTDAEPILDVYFRGVLLNTIFGFDYDPASVNYIENLINNNDNLAGIIRYDHGKTFYDFADADDSLDTGVAIPGFVSSTKIGRGSYKLANGDSGLSSIDITSDVTPKITGYDNVDLYNIDYIVAPGYPEQAVHTALLNVCDVRQDCFAVLDMPELAGSNAVSNAVRWINGEYTGRSEKINSIYGTLYFPYVKFRKRMYNSNVEIATVLGDYSPTSKIAGAISRSDYIYGASFSAPAGETRGLLNSIEGLQVTLSAKDRERLYADTYDACINPIGFNIESGFFIDGQKTTLRKNESGRLTALSRISVMRTGLALKKEIQRIVKFYFYEPSDTSSRASFAASITKIMNGFVDKRAIEDNFVVICDESNNPPDVTNNNGLIAQVEFTPINLIERIKVFANIRNRTATVTVV